MPEKLAQKKWDAVLVSLWQGSRFVSYFYQDVQFVPSEKIATLALALYRGRVVLYYDIDFVNRCTVPQCIALLIHEMLHVVFQHEHRAGFRRNRYLQNLAQDMVINTFIEQKKKSFFSGFDDRRHDQAPLELPRSLPRIPRRFYEETGIKDPRWEELYQWLAAQERNYVRGLVGGKDREDQNPSVATELRDTIHDALYSDPYEDEAGYLHLDDTMGLVFIDEANETLPTGVHLLHDAAAQRTLNTKKDRAMEGAAQSTDLVNDRAWQEITSLLKGTEKINTTGWERVLASVVDYSAPSIEWTLSSSHFNRRFMDQGLYLPGRVYHHLEMLTVVVDVSASMVMHPGELERAFGALEHLLDRFRIYLLCLDEQLFVPGRDGSDARPHSSTKGHRYRRGDWRMLKTGMSGTTFFAPLFNDYLRGHRETVAVMTDGHIYDLQNLVPYEKTVWIITEERREPFSPPFGTVIDLEGPHG